MDKKAMRPRNKRLETLNLVSFTHHNPDGEVDMDVVGRTLDLSEGGILLEVPHPVPSPGTDVEITIGIRDNVIRARGNIVHQRQLPDGNCGLGIAFSDLSEEDARTISAFLQEEER